MELPDYETTIAYSAIFCFCRCELFRFLSKEAWKCLDNSYKTLLTDPKQSAAYSMQAYDILKQTTDSALIVYTLSMSGHAYMLYGNFDLSMNVYYKALSYCPEKDLKAKAKINLNLGTLYVLKELFKSNGVD